MYRVYIKEKFDAAHRINDYDGPCKYLHGHTWEVIVCCEVRSCNNNTNIAIDLRSMKEAVRSIVSKLDHTHLNLFFKEDNVTCEYLAKYFYDCLKDKFPVKSITIKEGDGGWVEYTE